MLPEHFETERLRFRKLTQADLQPLLEFFKDPEATQFLHVNVDPEQFASDWLTRQIRRHTSSSTGLSAVELRETGELIGQCGILLQFVDGIPKLEIGYHFIPRFWGNGYATEAAIACRNFAFENELAETIISLIHPENKRSKSVALRNGMSMWKHTNWKGNPVDVYRIKREEWEKINL